MLRCQRASTPLRNARPQRRLPNRDSPHQRWPARRNSGVWRRRWREPRRAERSRWSLATPSPAHLAHDISAGTTDHSTVHIGRATARTCEIGTGPRYRLSQLFGTRVLTRHISPGAPRCRLRAGCGSARPAASTSADLLRGRREPLTATPSGPSSPRRPRRRPRASERVGLHPRTTPRDETEVVRPAVRRDDGVRRDVILRPRGPSNLRPPRALAGALARLASRFQSGLVFCHPDGTPLDPDNFAHRDWARALRRAELRRVRFHDLRHTYASLLIAQGAHPKYIQVQLGHASIQMTLDRYGHLMPDAHAAEAQKLDRLVFGDNGHTGGRQIAGWRRSCCGYRMVARDDEGASETSR